MDVTVNVFPGNISIMAAIISLATLGIGIYIVFLLIKTLRIYVKKNS